MDDRWTAEAIAYEKQLRSKSARELCNKKDVEQMRYTLRVALEKLQAAERKLQIPPAPAV